MSEDFLVELGTEELPPKSLSALLSAFRSGIQLGLEKQGLSFGAIEEYASPRRLAVLVKQLDSLTPAKELVAWGPPAKIAFDADGSPSKAALAFANKNGLEASSLVVENDGKADKLVHRSASGGVDTRTLLGSIVNESLTKLPIPKRMRWGAKRTEFVRPVHWLILLFGSDVVDAEIMGLKAGRETRGHRFHYNKTLSINTPAEYVETLRSPAHIIVDMNERKKLIKDQVTSEATKLGGIAVIDDGLLSEVNALVEWPTALAGRFEERFLEVPSEALISSMKEHQKYFHVVDNTDQLLPHFITVANIISTDPAQVIDGNERVIRPRLADAAFFFETDKKTSLLKQRERLKSVVFQAKLGTVYDKTERVAKLASAIAGRMGTNTEHAERAGILCKSDLVSDMVSEFDKMQGIAGYYYAVNDGEALDVSKALNEQYLPRFAGDVLPETSCGVALALADRLDTLTGIFGVGLLPTGSKDPFALRRASVAVLRLLVEKDLDLDLRDLLTQAIAGHKNLSDGDQLVETILAYMIERFRAGYEDAKIPAEVFMAVSAKSLSTPLDINKRVLAVHQFGLLPEAQSLAAANKRVSNILAKQADVKIPALNQALLQEPAEQALAKAVAEKSKLVEPLFAQANYADALAQLADLRDTVDQFFDDVMVMADDEALRNNRLALLSQLRGLFLEVADISLLVPAKK